MCKFIYSKNWLYEILDQLKFNEYSNKLRKTPTNNELELLAQKWILDFIF